MLSGLGRVRSCLLLAMAPLASSLLVAQERTPPAKATTQPAVVLATSKIEQILANTTYLMRTVSQPEMGGMAKMMADQFTRGLDRTRPVGVTITIDPNGNPDPLIILPIADLKAFFAGLVNLGEPEELGGGLYAMNVGVRPVFLRQIDQWLVVAQQEESAKGLQQVPTDLIQDLSRRYDIGAKIDVESVPAQLKDLIIDQMSEAFARTAAVQAAKISRELDQAEANAKTEEEKQAIAARRELIKITEANQEAQLKQISDLVHGTKQVIAGLLIDPANKHLLLEVGTEFIPGSSLDEQVTRSATAKFSFPKLNLPNPAFSLHTVDVMDPEQVALLERTFASGFDAFLAEASRSDKTPAGVEALLRELKPVLQSTIHEGVIDMAASATLVPNLNLAYAVRVADGNQIAATLKKGLSNLPQAGGKVDIRFDAATHQGTTLHLGSIPLPGDADPVARKVFTDAIHFAIGTNQHHLYLCLGPQAESNLKSLLDGQAGVEPAVPTIPMNLRLDVGQIVEYAHSVEPTPISEVMMKALQNAGDFDQLIIASRFVKHGAVATITVQEGILKAAGAAAKAGQQGGQPRPGGF